MATYTRLVGYLIYEIMATMPMADKVLFFFLVLGIQLTPSQADICNCGPNWDVTQCAVVFDGCSAPTSFQEVIPSAPAGIWPGYFKAGSNLGLKVTFEAPQENTALARIFDVRVIAMDYPVGFDMCVRVRLDPRTLLEQNQTFELQCLNNPDLIPRQRFNIMVQPYPTDRHSSNMINYEYKMPGCSIIGTVGEPDLCENYNHPEAWKSKYIRVEPDSCGGLCVKVFFDTYHWPNDDGVSSYRISVCQEHIHCPNENTKLVDCKDILNTGTPVCNTTFYGLDPGEYRAQQIVDDIDVKGNPVRGNSIIKSSFFTIADPSYPIIRNIPKDIIIKVQGSNETHSVMWKAPNVSNYIPTKVNMTSNFEPGDNFTVGVWTVTYIAEDYYKHRKTEESFTISIVDTTVTPKPPQNSASDNQQNNIKNNNQNLVIGVSVAGVAMTLFLLLLILFLKVSKRPFKKRDDSSMNGSNGRPSQTPTESTDPTVNERDNLVRNTQVIDGSYDNGLCSGFLDGTLSQYPTYDDDEFQKVYDKYSLDGQVFGPSYPPTYPPNPQQYRPKVTVNCNITAGLSDKPTTWVTTTHVENDNCLKSIEPETVVNSKNYIRQNTCDSGIGEYSDIQSISQVSYSHEF